MTRRSPLAGFGLGAILLAVWPAAASPFHEPKRWLFVALTAVAVGLTVRDVRRWSVAALPLVVVTTLRPSVDALAFAWALVAWPALASDRQRALELVRWSGALVALVVLAQALGVDPLASFQPEGLTVRLARYGTLGNPDFVASALLPIAVLCAPRAGDVVGLLRLLLICVALTLTESLAAVLGAALAAAAWLAHLRTHGGVVDPKVPRRTTRLLVSALLLLLALPLLSRDVERALRGRLYLVAVALPHVTEAPMLGQGPGAVVEGWPRWELEHWQARCGDATCVQQHPDGRFTGLQDHVHADWLEVVLERGLLGLAALLVALGVALRTAWRNPQGAPVFAALVAALTRTLVDFPLERPADLAVLAFLVSLAPPEANEPADVAPAPRGR